MFLPGGSSQRLHQGLDHIILQGGLSILQAKAESKTFFVRFQSSPPIFIKQNNGLHNLSCRIYRDFRSKSIDQILCRDALLDDLAARCAGLRTMALESLGESRVEAHRKQPGARCHTNYYIV